MSLHATTGATHAQAPFAGNYSGNLYVSLSGVVTLPESAAGAVLLTLDPSGNVRNGQNVTTGPVVGTVDPMGKVTFAPPLGGQISSGQIAANTLAGTNVVNSGGLITRYRVQAIRQGPVEFPPVLLTPLPATLSTNIGASVLLSVSLSGGTASLQWFAGLPGDVRAPILDATNATYQTPPLLGASNYWFRASNSAGVVQSGTRITVTGKLAAPSFTLQPVAQTVATGASVTFSALATGTAPIT